MTDEQLDDLVALIHEKRAELRTLGSKVAKSAKDATVAFVDLSDSTALKEEVAPDEWLGYVYEFIKSVSDHARAESGSVIKRIGDEVMLSFTEPASAERFFDRLAQDENMMRYRFKAAVDAGEVFHFQFAPALAPDPYGQVVDRCARIAKLAAAGIVLCSEPYRKRMANQNDYVELGEFPFKGIQGLQKVFFRPLQPAADPSFVEPLLDVLNNPSAAFSGYKIASRTISRRELNAYSDAYRAPRPFLLRELLNVPKLPKTLHELETELRSTNDPDRMTRYVGFLVEWDAPFEKFKRDQNGIDLELRVGGGMVWGDLSLRLTLNNLEVVRGLKPGDRVFFRGIIMRISLGIELNYVELQRVVSATAA